jgi:hypothetical protein
LPATVAVSVQVPAATGVTEWPDTVQIAGLPLVRTTGFPDSVLPKV